MPVVTSLVGASAAPNQAPAVSPQIMPIVCRRRRRGASSVAGAGLVK
jgi:hypothetical protein